MVATTDGDQEYSIAAAASGSKSATKFAEGLDGEDEEVVHSAEEKAERRFHELIQFIPEEGSRAEMQLKLEATTIGKLRVILTVATS